MRKIPEINMYSGKLNRYIMQDVLTTTLYYVHSYISESVRHLHVFNNNVAVPDVLETIFFQFKLIGWRLKLHICILVQVCKI